MKKIQTHKMLTTATSKKKEKKRKKTEHTINKQRGITAIDRQGTQQQRPEHLFHLSCVLFNDYYTLCFLTVC